MCCSCSDQENCFVPPRWSESLKVTPFWAIPLRASTLAHIDHHECTAEGGSQRWLLDAVRVPLFEHHVDLRREDMLVEGEVAVVAVIVEGKAEQTMHRTWGRTKLSLATCSCSLNAS